MFEDCDVVVGSYVYKGIHPSTQSMKIFVRFPFCFSQHCPLENQNNRQNERFSCQPSHLSFIPARKSSITTSIGQGYFSPRDCGDWLFIYSPPEPAGPIHAPKPLSFDSHIQPSSPRKSQLQSECNRWVSENKPRAGPRELYTHRYRKNRENEKNAETLHCLEPQHHQPLHRTVPSHFFLFPCPSLPLANQSIQEECWNTPALSLLTILPFKGSGWTQISLEQYTTPTKKRERKKTKQKELCRTPPPAQKRTTLPFLSSAQT